VDQRGAALDQRGAGVKNKAAPWLIVLAAILIVAYGFYWGYRAADARAWAIQVTGGNPTRAPRLMLANGCAGCHTIPGVPGAIGRVGPPLDGIAQRKYIAGKVNNSPESLIHWIQDARSIDPKTAMPSTQISDRDARDIAAYLYALE
jgi:cytochrome c1